MRAIIGLGLVLVMASGCGDDSDGGGDTAGSGASSAGGGCKAVCDISAAANCSNEDDLATCMSGCEDLLTLDGCESEGKAFVSCAAVVTTADLECDADGESELKGTKCANEMSAVQTCIAAQSGGDGDGDAAGDGDGDGDGDAGGDTCQYALDDECDEPNACNVGTDTTDCDAARAMADSCQYALDDTCDEPDSCDTGTDSTDCDAVAVANGDTCQYALDSVCDEPDVCDTDTDTTDCM